MCQYNRWSLRLARILNLLFGGLLVKNQMVANRDFSCVHAWMDEHHHVNCCKPTIMDLAVSENKELILSKATQTEAKVLTDYLRVALGHMLLSLLSEGFAFDSDYTLIKTAYKVYLDRGFDRCRLNGMLLGGSITNTH